MAEELARVVLEAAFDGLVRVIKWYFWPSMPTPRS